VRATVAAAVLLCLALLGPALALGRKAPLIAAAGDISCTPPNPDYNNGLGTGLECEQQATSDLLGLREWSAVLALGDLTYDDDSLLSGFQSSFDPTWGRWKAAMHPAIGNHEYDGHSHGAGYWDYFNGSGNGNGRAGPRGHGWYAFNLGSWRLIALNSNCYKVHCEWNSAQVRFLRHQLEKTRNRCVLLYWHHPRFSSGMFEEDMPISAFWKAAYRGGADVILNGHDHIYERFAPQDPAGHLDHVHGVTQFTVGTGGYFLFPMGKPAANTRFRENTDFGILAMHLAQGRYSWKFMAVPDGRSLDSGSQRCNKPIPKPKHRKHHKHHHHHHRPARATTVRLDG
jgi:acid phosphatase type 7